jgi:hypothetical protein
MFIIGDNYLVNITGASVNINIDEDENEIQIWRATATESLSFETAEGAEKFFNWLKEGVRQGKAFVDVATFDGEKPELAYEADTLQVAVVDEEEMGDDDEE